MLVLRTFSKIYGLAGLRVGYAVGPSDVCAAMAKLRRPFDVTTTAQVAALASLGDAAEIARRRALNAAGPRPRSRRSCARTASSPPRGAGRQLRLRRDSARTPRALFERLLARGRDRPPAREASAPRPRSASRSGRPRRTSSSRPPWRAAPPDLAADGCPRRVCAMARTSASLEPLRPARGTAASACSSSRRSASGLGNWLAVIALQVDVYDRTQSGWWVGELLIANILPAVFIGLLLGPLVDRLSRKGLMIGSDLGRLAVFAALPFADSAAAIVAARGRSPASANAFFRPAVLAGLPNLVGDGRAADRERAASSSSTGRRPRSGRSLGGAIVAASGPHLAYWVNAVTFAFSAVLVALIPAQLLQSERPIGRGRWGDLAEGYGVVRRSRVRCVNQRSCSVSFSCYSSVIRLQFLKIRQILALKNVTFIHRGYLFESLHDLVANRIYSQMLLLQIVGLHSAVHCCRLRMEEQETGQQFVLCCLVCMCDFVLCILLIYSRSSEILGHKRRGILNIDFWREIPGLVKVSIVFEICFRYDYFEIDAVGSECFELFVCQRQVPFLIGFFDTYFFLRAHAFVLDLSSIFSLICSPS